MKIIDGERVGKCWKYADNIWIYVENILRYVENIWMIGYDTCGNMFIYIYGNMWGSIERVSFFDAAMLFLGYTWPKLGNTQFILGFLL